MTSQPDRVETMRLLSGAGRGEQHALAGLTERVYAELRALAAHYIQKERSGHTLEPTALVHEVFLRLIDSKGLQANDRRHFFAIAAGAMRRVLVDHARTRDAAKRGGGRARVALSTLNAAATNAEADAIVLDEALTKLANFDARQARIVELRFFGGLTVEEVADLLQVSKRTIESEWTMARAWLHRELSGGASA
ncbi:MAG: ECF-type sigma factor [Phycisphaerales bacterium]